jgi:glycosyltransferase involved in cell wall biosynthesis
MKIVMVIYSLQHGGAERVVANLSTEWAALGWQVCVVTLTSRATDFYRLDDKVERIALNLAGLAGGPMSGAAANVRRILALRGVFRTLAPDVVLGIQSTASVLSILAGVGLPCKLVATEHIHPPMLPIGRFWDFVRRWSYPLADTVVALTEESRKWVEIHCHCKNVKVVPNWVSLPIPMTEPMLRPDDFVAPGRRMLLAAGRMTEQKGFDYLIDAFARVAAQAPLWDLVILGEGEDRKALEQQRADAGLVSRVFLPGQVGNVSDWYARTDLYVLSSRFEGFGMTLVEAMASGCAAISFDCDAGPRDIIAHGQNGLLVSPVGDVDNLAAAMLALMTNDAERALMASRAPAVQQMFSPRKVLAMWQDVFDQTAASHLRSVDSLRVNE